MLDAGCGTGDAQAELGARYPHARYVGLDLALPMVAAARAKAGAAPLGAARASSRPSPADAPRASPASCAATSWRCRLRPERSTSCGATSRCSGSETFPRRLAEMNRVLAVDGLASFHDVRSRHAEGGPAPHSPSVDRHVHVSRFVDMHDVGDMLVGRRVRRSGHADGHDDRLPMTTPRRCCAISRRSARRTPRRRGRER